MPMKNLAVALALVTCLPGCDALQRRPAADPEANMHSLQASRTALTEGEAETALGIALGVLAEQPHNVGAMVSAGDAELALGERTAAKNSYQNALAENPRYVPARLGLAKMKMRDDIKGAEAEFRAIVATEPRNTAALTDLGVTLDLQERHKAAQAVYATALQINPDMTSTRVDLALSLALSGDPVRAEQMLRDASDSGPVPPKVRADYAVAQVLAGHSKEAEETLQQDISPAEAHSSVQGMQALLPPQPAK